ncbi:MAG: hypothetical protein KGZ57_03470 [Dethiobacter sp.]|nr:hypothetical protein [Dethiobacter sp.]MCL5981373.1 hypothetical protein [Bacillota bacterium]
MKILRLFLVAIMLLLSIVLVVPVPASAALPTASIIAGREQAVYISFSAEDGSEGTAPIKARLQQDAHVLEHVFLALHKAGKLDSRYPLLLVRVRHQADAFKALSPSATELSFTPAVALVSGFPSGGPAGGIYRTENLGRAYMIDTTLTSFKDLLALVLLLPRLGEQSPAPLTIEDAETLAQVKTSPEYQAFIKRRLEFRPPLMNWGSSEVQGLLAVWERGVLSYVVCDQAENKLFELKPLDYYLARPSWSLPALRLIAAATETDLYLVELLPGKTHRLDLATLFPQKYLQMAGNITLAINLHEKKVYFTLDRNLPESFWQLERHTYSVTLDTGEIRVVESITPREPDPAPASPPASGPGVVTEFVAPAPGDVSPVHQLMNGWPAGWHFGQISRHEGYLNPYLAEVLPKDSPLVFRPAGLMAQRRFVAYGSQEELVLFDIFEERHHILSLHEWRPADYTEISAIRFAQHPSHLGNKIYFSLESRNATMAAYVWDLLSSRVELVEKTLEDKQKLGWQEFSAGAANHLLPQGSRLLTGSDAKGSISGYYLSLLADAFLALSAWLLLLFIAFGLPFVLAHTLTFLAAVNLKSARLLFSFGPALATVLFLALSLLAVRLTMSNSELIKGLVYPLPWYYHLGSTAGMIFMMGFITVVTAVLTILVFHQARVLPEAFFQGANGRRREEKGMAFSAGVVYGLAGAVLLFLLFALAAVTLPYQQWPRGLDVLLFSAMVYVLCLAVTFYLLRATPVAAGYLTAAAAFLAVGYVTLDSIRIIRVITDYEQSVIEVVRQLFALERWLGHMALLLPLTLTCMVYLLRKELLRRGRTLKAPAALALAGLVAVPATLIILYGELLPWYVPGLGIFAYPAAFFLFVLTAASIVAALVQVFASSSQQSLPVKVTLPTAAPTAKKIRFPIGLAATGVAALVVFLQLVMERAAELFVDGPLAWLLLVALIYLAIASVFYLGRFLTVRVAGALFTPERVREMASKP